MFPAAADIVLEGWPGTSKTTILKAITAEWVIPSSSWRANANAGPSPWNCPLVLRLDLLLDVIGEHDCDLGQELARIGRDSLLPPHKYRRRIRPQRRLHKAGAELWWTRRSDGKHT